MIYAWIGALFIGVSLGLLGSGGSILAVPILHYIVGHPEKQAIAEALAVVGAIALFGAIRAGTQRRVSWRHVGWFGLPSMAAAYAGSWLGRFVPGPLQLALLALVMLAAAYMMFRPSGSKGGPKDAPPIPKPGRRTVLAAQGAALGVLTGLVGVGGGFLIVPALVLIGRLPMRRAVGTSLAVITLNCVTAFFKHAAELPALGERLDWTTILVFAAIGIAGSLAGSELGGKINQAVLRRVFALFLVAVAIYMLVKELPQVGAL